MTQQTALPQTDTPWPAQGQWTYQDYLKLPDDGRIYEIIEGVLYMTNAPNIDHQYTVMEIAFQLKRFIDKQQLGYVLTAPFEVHLTDKTRPVQPDILFIKTEKWPKPGAKYFQGAPDLIVEVMSPSSQRRDRVVKFTAYEQAGVLEYWIVNPKTKSVELFTLPGPEYVLVGEFIGEEIIESKLLPELQIKANSLFR